MRQSIALLRLRLNDLTSQPARLLPSVLAVALAVFVLALFLQLQNGFSQIRDSSGSSRVAVIVSKGARDEQSSSISRDVYSRLVPELETLGVRPGSIAASRRRLADIEFADQQTQSIPFEGTDTMSTDTHPGFRLEAGRLFTPGQREIVLGTGLMRRHPELKLGDRLSISGGDWKIVGLITSPNIAYSASVITSLSDYNTALRLNGDVQLVRLGPVDPQKISGIKTIMEKKFNRQIVALPETVFMQASSAGSGLFLRMGWPLGLIMSVGSVAGVVNVLNFLVSTREREFATLKTIGFSPGAILISSLVEAVVLTVIGAVFGVILSLTLSNGFAMTTNAGSLGQIVFTGRPDGGMFLEIGLFTLAIGVIGGLGPALRAARIDLRRANA
ncbi:MAG: ABC transporter permease [bacterium]|nr:ABC transporter permease [bacterium]